MRLNLNSFLKQEARTKKLGGGSEVRNRFGSVPVDADKFFRFTVNGALFLLTTIEFGSSAEALDPASTLSSTGNHTKGVAALDNSDTSADRRSERQVSS